MHSSLLGLPTAVAATESLAGVADELKLDFNLTEKKLASIKPFAGPGGPTDAWAKWTDSLTSEVLIQAPILDPETFQLFSTQAATNRALGRADGTFERPLRGEPLNVTSMDDENIPPRLNEIVRRAGFPESVVSIVTTRIARDARPSLLLDRDRTESLANEAANGIEPVMIEHTAGEVVYRAGDTVTVPQHQEAIREATVFTTGSVPRAQLM